MSALPAAFVLLNRAAHHGQANGRWRELEGPLAARYAMEVVPVDAAGCWLEPLRAAVGRGGRTFIAAGGDGTVHALLNGLEQVKGELPWHALCIGAVGLGSSNDFHKPVVQRLGGVPVRVEARSAEPRDLGRAIYWDAHGERRERLFAVSASVGATARANAFFNRGDALLRWIKGRSIPLAIAYAAVRTLLVHRGAAACVTVDGVPHELRLANLSVSKTPYLSGSLRYDTPVEPASRRLLVNACAGTGRFGLFVTLVALSLGRFRGLPWSRAWQAIRVELDAGEPFELELDGEVVRACRARFELVASQPRVCTC